MHHRGRNVLAEIGLLAGNLGPDLAQLGTGALEVLLEHRRLLRSRHGPELLAADRQEGRHGAFGPAIHGGGVCGPGLQEPGLELGVIEL